MRNVFAFYSPIDSDRSGRVVNGRAVERVSLCAAAFDKQITLDISDNYDIYVIYILGSISVVDEP
jgi:hypothetical protein